MALRCFQKDEILNCDGYKHPIYYVPGTYDVGSRFRSDLRVAIAANRKSYCSISSPNILITGRLSNFQI